MNKHLSSVYIYYQHDHDGDDSSVSRIVCSLRWTSGVEERNVDSNKLHTQIIRFTRGNLQTGVICKLMCVCGDPSMKSHLPA